MSSSVSTIGHAGLLVSAILMVPMPESVKDWEKGRKRRVLKQHVTESSENVVQLAYLANFIEHAQPWSSEVSPDLIGNMTVQGFDFRSDCLVILLVVFGLLDWQDVAIFVSARLFGFSLAVWANHHA